MDAKMPPARRLSAADLPRALDVVSRAFRDDPMMVHLFPDGEKRARLTPRILRMLVGPEIDNGQAYGVGKPIEGVAAWTFPDQRGPTSMQYLRAGLLGVLFSPALLSAAVRARGIFGPVEAMHRRHAPQPHYYLNVLAVAPESRGKGLASRLVKPVLAQADERSQGAYLETLNPRNVPMYEHFGFTCVEEHRVPETDLGIWALYRPPRA